MTTAAEISNWIADHKELVTLVAIPVVTLVVTTAVSLITTWRGLQSQREDRALQKSIKLHDERKAEIEELKKLVVRFEALSNLTSFDLRHGLSSGEAGKLPAAVTKEAIAALIQMTTEVFVRIDCDEDDRKRLMDSMWAEIGAISGAKKVELEAKDRFAPVAPRLIKQKEKTLLSLD